MALCILWPTNRLLLQMFIFARNMNIFSESFLSEIMINTHHLSLLLWPFSSPFLVNGILCVCFCAFKHSWTNDWYLIMQWFCLWGRGRGVFLQQKWMRQCDCWIAADLDTEITIGSRIFKWGFVMDLRLSKELGFFFIWNCLRLGKVDRDIGQVVLRESCKKWSFWKWILSWRGRKTMLRRMGDRDYLKIEYMSYDSMLCIASTCEISYLVCSRKNGCWCFCLCSSDTQANSVTDHNSRLDKWSCAISEYLYLSNEAFERILLIFFSSALSGQCAWLLLAIRLHMWPMCTASYHE